MLCSVQPSPLLQDALPLLALPCKVAFLVNYTEGLLRAGPKQALLGETGSKPSHAQHVRCKNCHEDKPTRAKAGDREGCKRCVRVRAHGCHSEQVQAAPLHSTVFL